MLQEEANAAAASSAAASAVAPSAPVALDLPSAPPLAPVETYQSNECVVCLENKVRLFPLILISNTLYSFFFMCFYSATSSFFLAGMFVHVGNAKLG